MSIPKVFIVYTGRRTSCRDVLTDAAPFFRLSGWLVAFGKDETKSATPVLAERQPTGTPNRERGAPGGTLSFGWELPRHRRAALGGVRGWGGQAGVWDSSQDVLNLPHSHKAFRGWQRSWKNAALENFQLVLQLCAAPVWDCAAGPGAHHGAEIKTGNKKAIGWWQDHSTAMQVRTIYGQYNLSGCMKIQMNFGTF